MAATSPGDESRSIQTSSIDGEPPAVTSDSSSSQPNGTTIKEESKLVRKETTSHPLDEKAG